MFAFKDYILFHTYRDTRCEVLSILSDWSNDAFLQSFASNLRIEM